MSRRWSQLKRRERVKLKRADRATRERRRLLAELDAVAAQVHLTDLRPRLVATVGPPNRQDLAKQRAQPSGEVSRISEPWEAGGRSRR